MQEDTLMVVMFSPEKKKLSFTSQKVPMQIIQNGFPMDRLATDIMDKLPLTESGSQYILLVSDYFILWTECFANAKCGGENSGQGFIASYNTVTIHSDQGRQYDSELFKQECNLLQIEKTHTTPCHP